MKIHVIQHASFETPGIIQDWAMKKGHQLLITHSYRSETLPPVDDIDFLILLGGPQSMIEKERYPYLLDEMVLIREAIHAKKIVLGICLGAQLIAESVGAKTEVSPNKEIGIFPIQLTHEGEKDPLFSLFPTRFNVMHWHSDMPGLPKKATLLAQSQGCPRQAFRYGDRVYAFQFHIEVTPTLIKNMIDHEEGDLTPGSTIQEVKTMMATDLTEMNTKMYCVLDYLLRTSQPSNR